MFNDNFYPSPEAVTTLLLEDLTYMTGKILEPSAGKGDLAEAIKRKTKADVECIEIEMDLQAIISQKGFPLVAENFLNYETYTEYDAIIMNPPFDNGVKHLLKAIRLAENQVFKECQIRCILNAETIKNPFSLEREVLNQLLNKYQATITFHKDLFMNAERKTPVETAIIYLTVDPVKKKMTNLYSTILSSATTSNFSELETSLSTVVHQNEVGERVASIKTLVTQYEAHIKLVRERFKADRNIAYFESLIPGSYYSTRSNLNDINEDIMRIRRSYWTQILNTEEFSEKLTQYGTQQLQKQLEESSVLEINLTNIQLLLMAVTQNASNICLDSCIHFFEDITKYHQRDFSSNVHYFNGWKTNDAYKVNKKFIKPFYRYGDGFYTSDMGVRNYSGRSEEPSYENVTYEVRNFIDDLVKMLQLLDSRVSSQFTSIKLGEFENETIRFKMFSKGTVHVWIKDQLLLEEFNVICGQHFNWLPSDDEIKQDDEAREFMAKEFKHYTKKLKIAG